MRKLFSLLAAVLFASGMMANQVDLKYTAGVTTNMVGNGTNNAATVNLDPALFVVLSVKDSASNEIGLNKANDIRLYAHKNSGCGNALNVSIVAGTIDSIKLAIKQTATFTVKALSAEDTLEVALTDGVYAINAPTFAIKNVTSGATTQLQLNKITIYYTPDASFVSAPSFEPEEKVFKDTVAVVIKAGEGENVYYTLDESDPTVESTLYAGPFVLNATTTVKAIAERDGNISAIAEKLYKRADTLNVAQAKEVAEALKVNTTSDKVFVEGYAESVADYSLQYGNQDFYLVDAISEEPDSTFLVFRAIPEKDGAAYPVYAGDKVRLYGALKKYQKSNSDPIVIEMIESTVEFLEEVERPEEPVQLDTITIAEAIEIGDLLENKAYSEKEYVVEGFVIKAEDFYMANKNQTWNMADSAEAKSSRFKAYRCVPVFNGDTVQVLNGDKVRLLGKLQKYIQGTDTLIEITGAKAEFLSMVEGDHTAGAEIQSTIDTISVARALEIGGALAENGVSEDKYVIFGYVSNIVNYYDSINKNETFWMVDSLGGRAKTNATGAFEVYRGVPDIQAEIGLDAKVYVTSKIKKYKATSGAVTIETDGTPAVVVAEIGHEEVIDTISIDSALVIGAALADGGVSEKRYCLEGYVSYIANLYDASKKSENFWITSAPSEASSNADGAFYVYNGKPNNEQELGLGAKVRIVTTIKKYVKNNVATIENDAAVAVEVLEQGELIVDTLTVEEAYAEAMKLDKNKTGAKFYAVKGYIHKIKEAYNTTYKNASFYIAERLPIAVDDPDVYCYHASMNAADADKVVVGSYVIITGHLTNNYYNEKSSAQIATGSAQFVEAPKIDTIEVTPSEALTAGMELADNKLSADVYAVVGYVVRAAEYDSTEVDYQDFWLADEQGGEGVFRAYQASVPGLTGVANGNHVRLVGRLFKYVEGEDVNVQMKYGVAEIITDDEAIENIILTEKVQKVIVDGVLYIVRDGKLFNAQGMQVR